MHSIFFLDSEIFFFVFIGYGIIEVSTEVWSVKVRSVVTVRFILIPFMCPEFWECSLVALKWRCLEFEEEELNMRDMFFSRTDKKRIYSLSLLFKCCIWNALSVSYVRTSETKNKRRWIESTNYGPFLHFPFPPSFIHFHHITTQCRTLCVNEIQKWEK